jgi:hypothetical protein
MIERAVQMPGRRVKAVAVIVIICLVFTCSACSQKDKAEGPDNSTAIMDPGGPDGSGTNRDGADEAGVSDTESANDQVDVPSDGNDASTAVLLMPIYPVQRYLGLTAIQHRWDPGKVTIHSMSMRRLTKACFTPCTFIKKV